MLIFLIFHFLKFLPYNDWIIINLDFSQLFRDPIDLATPTLAKPPGARVEHRDFQNVPIFTAISGDELVRVRCGIWALESGYWRYAARVASHLLAHLSLIFLFQYHWRDQGTIICTILESGIEGSGDPRRKCEEMGEREREREKCCFCLQNDLKEP